MSDRRWCRRATTLRSGVGLIPFFFFALLSGGGVSSRSLPWAVTAKSPFPPPAVWGKPGVGAFVGPCTHPCGRHRDATRRLAVREAGGRRARLPPVLRRTRRQPTVVTEEDPSTSTPNFIVTAPTHLPDSITKEDHSATRRLPVGGRRARHVVTGSMTVAVAVLAWLHLLLLPHHPAPATLETTGLLHGLALKLAPPGYHFYQSLIAGGLAGFSRGLSRILTFPLDTVKTREQAILAHDPSMEEMVTESKHVNTGRLFDGITPMLLIAAPANAAFFVAHDYIMALASAAGAWSVHGWRLELAAALIASLPSNAVRIPAEVLKQRVQAGVEKDSVSAARNIMRDEGLAGLYQGGGAQLIRELPFNAVQFMVFGSLMNALAEHHLHNGLLEKAVVGAVAAGAAGLFTQPMDVVKTQQMIDKEHKEGEAGWLSSVASIYRRYGVGGLYLGTLPRLGLCAIGGGCLFVADEIGKSLFH